MPADSSASAAPPAASAARTLYIAATPIGNLADISRRAAALLQTAQIIAAEDTRVARRLLAGAGIKTAGKIISLRGHNEARASATLAAAVGAGRHAVYISDAGTPAISDPGAKLARRARAAGLAVSPVPGASALTALLSVAGVANGADEQSAVHFFGFPPRAKNKQREFFLQLRQLHGVAVFFESPRRIGETLAALADALGGEQRAVLGRELTKLHEQIVDADLSALAEKIAAGSIPQRGEFTLLVELPNEPAAAADAKKLFALLAKELPPRRAAAIAAKATGATGADELYAAHIKRGKK